MKKPEYLSLALRRLYPSSAYTWSDLASRLGRTESSLRHARNTNTMSAFLFVAILRDVGPKRGMSLIRFVPSK